MVSARTAIGTACITAAVAMLPPLSDLDAEVAPSSTAKLVLDWLGPPHCPDQAAVLADVESLLAHSRLGAGGERIYAQGRVIPFRGGYRMRLEVDGARRELDGPSCENLARAAALLIALVLNPQLQPPSDPLLHRVPSATGLPPASATGLPSRPPSASTSSRSPSPAESSSPAAAGSTFAEAHESVPARSQVVLPDSPSTSGTQPSRANQVWLHLGPVLDAGTLPSPAVLGAVGAAWAHSFLRLSARLSWAAPVQWEVAPSGRVTFQAYGVGTRACADTPGSWLRGGLCIGLEGLRVEAHGNGLADPRSGGAWLLAVGGDADVRVRVWDTWFLAAEAGLFGPLVGLNIQVDGGPNYRSGATVRFGVFLAKVFQVF